MWLNTGRMNGMDIRSLLQGVLVPLRVAVLLVWLLAGADRAWAGEIRILDPLGLTRAVVASEHEVSVSITLRADSVSDVHLSRRDGLGPQIEPSSRSGTTLIFSGVGDGTWEITGTGGERDPEVLSVTFLPRNS